MKFKIKSFSSRLIKRLKSDWDYLEAFLTQQIFCPSRCHRPRDSLFTWSSGFDNFTGLVNWGFLLLTMGGFRLLLENFIKYGIRIDPVQWFIVLTGKDEGVGYPSIILMLCKFKVVFKFISILISFLITSILSLHRFNCSGDHLFSR